ncbi:MAG: DUF354 domain-containing protein [Porphyromonadaceae bacterium]|jgi:predicted glycosyltransferase|nr:DUF354 domain-containing protein [Porphyromonadaceae bacterium]
MKVAIFLGHPAHFHMFKFVAKQLKARGHTVEFVIKQKDILEQLLLDANYDYTVIREKERTNNSKLGLITSLLKMDLKMLKFLRRSKPDLLIGTYVVLLNKLSGVPVIVTNEDDAAVVPYLALTSYPLASAILNPVSCNSGRWDKKAIKYRGFQKLAYLHPNHFTPEKEVVSKYIDLSRPYFLLRFAKLNAHHDGGVSGINFNIAFRIIEILKPFGNIYISSERALEPKLENYRIKIAPLDIHHLLAFATMYIGDSQSMAVEAAMLGVPSVRFNDFAGKIGVLEELEHDYGLTYGIKTDKPELLFRKIEELLALPNLSEEFQLRRKNMLSEKIDVTAFLVDFIENYPKYLKDKETFEC